MNEAEEPKLEWFGGNKDALNIFLTLRDLLHIWDDLVDKDNPVSEAKINHAFLCCLVYLQANPLYKQVESQILPMWISVVSAYETANKFERDKDEHGLEIAHGLRYAAGNIISYIMHVCVGPEKAKEYMPQIWKNIFFERYEDYRKEHLDER